MMDVGRVRYRHVDRGIPALRLREVAAEARAFDPDPFAVNLPTYQRMVFLHSLYDIALSFEHSPLIGCSTFGLGPGATKDGHTLFARARSTSRRATSFDRDKAVYFVRGENVIPFASVAWPGLIGVMSGMNLEGVAVVVHGGRARDPVTDGEPVVFMLRDVLEHAHDTDEAIRILASQEVMVSHIVIVADAKGHFASVERAPGVAAFVHDQWKDPDRIGVTNHFEGPLKDDPKNLAVERGTTTLARRARLDEMLAGAVGPSRGRRPARASPCCETTPARAASHVRARGPPRDRRPHRDPRHRRGHDRQDPLGQRRTAPLGSLRPLRPHDRALRAGSTTPRLTTAHPRGVPCRPDRPAQRSLRSRSRARAGGPNNPAETTHP